MVPASRLTLGLGLWGGEGAAAEDTGRSGTLPRRRACAPRACVCCKLLVAIGARRIYPCTQCCSDHTTYGPHACWALLGQAHWSRFGAKHRVTCARAPLRSFCRGARNTMHASGSPGTSQGAPSHAPPIGRRGNESVTPSGDLRTRPKIQSQTSSRQGSFKQASSSIRLPALLIPGHHMGSGRMQLPRQHARRISRGNWIAPARSEGG